MPLLPFATFLVGALLTILVPLLLLIALAVWYWMVSVHVPDAADGLPPGTEPAEANLGPTIPETLPPEPGT